MTLSSSPYTPDRLLGYHPIVLGDQVIVCDGSKVVAYNLNDRPSGREGPTILSIEPAWKHDPENTVPQVNRANTGIPRYTLTAVGNRVYARMGASTPSGYMNMGRGGTYAASSIIASISAPRANSCGSGKRATWFFPTVPRTASIGPSILRGRRSPTIRTCTLP